MASFVFDEGAESLQDNSIVYATDVIKIRAVTGVPSRTDTAMTGHTGVGTDQTLGSKTRTKDTTNHRIVYDAADPAWTAVAGGSTIVGFEVYKFVTNDAGSTPIVFIDVTDFSTNGGDIGLQFSTDGIAYTQQ